MIYNQKQNFYYIRALDGVKAYTRHELNTMHWDKRKRVIKVHKRAQRVLNTYKQEKVIIKTNNVFSIFWNSKMCKELINDFNTVDETLLNGLSFKDLKIDKNDIVELLYNKGILPKNFYEL